MHCWPRLSAHLRPLRRLDGSVQFGLDPDSGIRLSGLTDGEVDWIRGLDGARDPWATGVAGGLGVDRIGVILSLLGARGVVTDPASSDEVPDRAQVWVTGSGLASALVADLLRHRGSVEVARLTGSEIPARRRRPDLIVLCGEGVIGGEHARHWRDAGVVHLPVALGAGWAAVGPVVETGAGPCLECVDLDRSDRDPSWPVLAAQTHAIGERGASAPAVLVAAVAAGLAAAIVGAHLTGDRGPRGLALEITGPWPVVRHHRWRRHPECDWCGAAPAATRSAQSDPRDLG